ncbi:hypothetical protein BJ138DRAFT_1158622 [Hygrophoropsis aurantiaca]|uniref:Uncharacterized protein n=1 Tax=Hygrophoropsis aurantiaca TaxID=72124 RepID=A0ACB8A5U3_9AGAM|nr:hypothetical protein BJ138DRAFT_1158622 [Hygrophoropsis aurantiaca]
MPSGWPVDSCTFGGLLCIVCTRTEPYFSHNMGIFASRHRVDVNIDSQRIAEMVIQGLGGRETAEAFRAMSEQLAKNSDEVVASVDRTLASLSTDVHDAVQDFSVTSDHVASSIHFALHSLVNDIHNAILCFMALVMTVIAYLMVLTVLRGMQERRERLLLENDTKLLRSLSGGSRRLVLVEREGATVSNEDVKVTTEDNGVKNMDEKRYDAEVEEGTKEDS